MTIELNDVLLYTDANGKVKIDVVFGDETVKPEKMAELFGVSLSTINEHLRNIFSKKLFVH